MAAARSEEPTGMLVSLNVAEIAKQVDVSASKLLKALIQAAPAHTASEPEGEGPGDDVSSPFLEGPPAQRAVRRQPTGNIFFPLIVPDSGEDGTRPPEVVVEDEQDNGGTAWNSYRPSSALGSPMSTADSSIFRPSFFFRDEDSIRGDDTARGDASGYGEDEGSQLGSQSSSQSRFPQVNPVLDPSHSMFQHPVPSSVPAFFDFKQVDSARAKGNWKKLGAGVTARLAAEPRSRRGVQPWVDLVRKAIRAAGGVATRPHEEVMHIESEAREIPLDSDVSALVNEAVELQQGDAGGRQSALASLDELATRLERRSEQPTSGDELYILDLRRSVRVTEPQPSASYGPDLPPTVRPTRVPSSGKPPLAPSTSATSTLSSLDMDGDSGRSMKTQSLATVVFAAASLVRALKDKPITSTPTEPTGPAAPLAPVPEGDIHDNSENLPASGSLPNETQEPLSRGAPTSQAKKRPGNHLPSNLKDVSLESREMTPTTIEFAIRVLREVPGKAYLLVAFALICSSTFDISMNLLKSGPRSMLLKRAWRSACALVICLPWSVWDTYLAPEKARSFLSNPRMWAGAIIYGIGLALWGGCYAWALSYTTLADAFLICNLHIVFSMIYDIVKTQSLQSLKITGTMLAVLGAWVACLDKNGPGLPGRHPPASTWGNRVTGCMIASGGMVGGIVTLMAPAVQRLEVVLSWYTTIMTMATVPLYLGWAYLLDEEADPTMDADDHHGIYGFLDFSTYWIGDLVAGPLNLVGGNIGYVALMRYYPKLLVLSNLMLGDQIIGNYFVRWAFHKAHMPDTLTAVGTAILMVGMLCVLVASHQSLQVWFLKLNRKQVPMPRSPTQTHPPVLKQE